MNELDILIAELTNGIVMCGITQTSLVHIPVKHASAIVEILKKIKEDSGDGKQEDERAVPDMAAEHGGGPEQPERN